MVAEVAPPAIEKSSVRTLGASNFAASICGLISYARNGSAISSRVSEAGGRNSPPPESTPAGEKIPGGSSGGHVGVIAGVAEAEDRIEDDTQKSQADPEAGAFAEAFCDIDRDEDRDDEVHERDDKQDDPPGRPPGDLQEHDQVVDRNDRSPAGLSRLFEDLPHPRNHDDRHDNADDDRDDTRTFGTVLGTVVVLERKQRQEGRRHALLLPGCPGVERCDSTLGGNRGNRQLKALKPGLMPGRARSPRRPAPPAPPKRSSARRAAAGGGRSRR